VGFFSDHFTTNLLLSLLVKFFLKLVNIWQSYMQEGGLSHALEELARDLEHGGKQLLLRWFRLVLNSYQTSVARF